MHKGPCAVEFFNFGLNQFNHFSMNPVVVTADQLGNVIIPSENNAEWGHVRVEQTRVQIDDKGFLRKSKMSALIHGKMEDLTEMGFFKGQKLPGKIVVMESLEPFNTKDPSRDYKVAGATGVVCCVDGQPIYRKTFFREDVNAQDENIQHNNTEDIKAAYKASLESTGTENVSEEEVVEEEEVFAGESSTNLTDANFDL